MRPNLFGAPRLSYLSFCCRLNRLAVAVLSVWRSVVRLSAAGEGAFTESGWGPQHLFSQKTHFLCLFLFFSCFQWLGVIFLRRTHVNSQQNYLITSGATPYLVLIPELPTGWRVTHPRVMAESQASHGGKTPDSTNESPDSPDLPRFTPIEAEPAVHRGFDMCPLFGRQVLALIQASAVALCGPGSEVTDLPLYT